MAAVHTKSRTNSPFITAQKPKFPHHKHCNIFSNAKKHRIARTVGHNRGSGETQEIKSKSVREKIDVKEVKGKNASGMRDKGEKESRGTHEARRKHEIPRKEEESCGCICVAHVTDTRVLARGPRGTAKPVGTVSAHSH